MSPDGPAAGGPEGWAAGGPDGLAAGGPEGWAAATDPAEVHALLLASDAAAAARSGTPPPVRSMDSTARLVAAGSVHVLRRAGRPVGTVTVGRRPPADLDESAFPPAARPAYLRRLAVDPAAGPLVGPQCVRQAVAIATADGADVLRSAANPDLADVLQLLTLLGFRAYGPVRERAGLRAVSLQLDLAAG